MSGTFLHIFSEMATDTLFHGFWFDLDSILRCFLVLGSENGYKKAQQKQTCKKITQEKTLFGKPPCGPLREQIQGSQDWQPNQGITDTPLVPAGTVADTKKLLET